MLVIFLWIFFTFFRVLRLLVISFAPPRIIIASSLDIFRNQCTYYILNNRVTYSENIFSTCFLICIKFIWLLLFACIWISVCSSNYYFLSARISRSTRFNDFWGSVYFLFVLWRWLEFSLEYLVEWFYLLLKFKNLVFWVNNLSHIFIFSKLNPFLN